VDVAVSGRPGPVVIAISEEMQKRVAEVADLGPVSVSPAHPDPAALARMMTMLAKAKRPLAVLGGSRWSEQARADIREFLVGNNVATAVSFRRQALYDGTRENYVGDLGVGSDPALVAKAQEADLVLAIGTRLGEPVSQGYTLFGAGHEAPIVHVHPEGSEIGRVTRPALGIVADVNAFAAAVKAERVAKPGWAGWTKELREIRMKGLARQEYEGLNLSDVMHSLAGLLEDDAILTCDAGNFATWPPRFINFKDGQRFIGPTNGAMGYGVPAAIGAAIAFRNRQVVCFVGDGGFLMTGQELATAFHHGVAPVILVFNNQMYGTIRMYQERTYPGRVSGTALTNPDFAKFIESFGGHGEVVEEAGQFADAFRRAAASGRPSVIELRMNPEQITSRATIATLRGGKAAKPAAAKAKRAPAVTHPARAAPKKKR
jgi:acetolactate synthase-1/2/3 large subunit